MSKPAAFGIADSEKKYFSSFPYSLSLTTLRQAAIGSFLFRLSGWSPALPEPNSQQQLYFVCCQNKTLPLNNSLVQQYFQIKANKFL